MNKIKKLLTAKNAGGVVLRILILLVIPYIYLLLCGLIFDKWLHLYSLTGFIFWSLMFFWCIALVLSVFCVLLFLKARSGKDAAHSAKKEKSNSRKRNNP